MRGDLFRALLMLLLVSCASEGQRNRSEEGFEIGTFRIRPVAEALGAYDNRVIISDSGDADGDFYSDLAAAVLVENGPALFDVAADAGYGYRFYNDYSEYLNNDFYQAGLAVATADRPLKLGLSSYLKKSLDYDTLYGPAPGQEPGAILTREPSTRYTVNADMAYEKMMTDKTSITPGYDYWYYFQDFTDREDAEWQVHRASLKLGYGYTGRTRGFLTGYYSLQSNEEEDGTIGALTVGAEGSVSEKTSWRAHLGYAAADYELSGSDQGFVGLLRGDWAITEKVSAYVYGSSNFQPGYSGGGARRVYRMGYGGLWRIYAHWSVWAQALHDYQEELVEDGGTGDDIKNFVGIRTEYGVTHRLALTGSIRYSMDEEDMDQMVLSLGVVYRY